jgi:hypothetical protein
VLPNALRTCQEINLVDEALLEDAPDVGPTNISRSAPLAPSGARATGAAAGTAARAPGSPISRNVPPARSSRTHRLSSLLPPGATAAYVTSASGQPLGSGTAASENTSAGSSTRSSAPD